LRQGYGRGQGRGHRWGRQLESSGIRPTLARELVFSVMESSEGHLSVEEVLQEVRKSEEGIGLTTVYRSLELLHSNGLVKKLDFGDGRAVFELSDTLSGKGPHQHLICRSCGQVQDLTGSPVDKEDFVGSMKSFIREKYRFTTENMEIKVYGLCSECG